MNALMLALTLLCFGSTHASAQAKVESVNPATVADARAWKLMHTTAESVEVDGHRAVRLVAEGDSANGIVGLALPTDLRFATGTIDIDLKGRNARQPSFLGVAFNVTDEKTFEAVYFRPFNFQAEEPMRSHAVQYVAWPVNTWEHLRKSAPGRFENRVDPVPDPERWFHATIVVTDDEVRVFVNGAKEPSLLTRRLLASGGARPAGLFVDSADGLYANFKVTPP
jgi:hypothetical protein